MRRRPFPLRIPKRPHVVGDRLVPVHGCGCATCLAAREQREGDAEAKHWARVGELLGLDDEQGKDTAR